MECPKCTFALAADVAECPRCGIIVAKFLRAHDAVSDRRDQSARSATGGRALTAEAEADAGVREERIARSLALPLALLLARLALQVSPGGVRMLTMWVHEAGHAVAAWLCGYSAWPGPWFTPVAEERSPLFVVLLLGLLLFGMRHAWRARQYVWTAAASTAALLMLIGTIVLRPGQAQQLIVFGGDGGCLVLGTALMLTVYAPAASPLRRERLRWGLLAIGALAFLDAWLVWFGPIDRLAFGQNENGLSDPSVLVEVYGWSVLALVARYQRLAWACAVVLGAAYLAGLSLSTAAAGESRHSDR